MTSKGPVFSIVVPTRNRPKLLAVALQSIADQSFSNYEVIIVDDNSNKEFISADYVYKNVTHIQSEYKGRGELFPFYYFHKNKFFDIVFN